MFIFGLELAMEVSDRIICMNCDWDPSYLSEIFKEEYYDESYFWNNGATVSDTELVAHVEKMDYYSPIVEDISLDDKVLCDAVQKIEEQ